MSGTGDHSFTASWKRRAAAFAKDGGIQETVSRSIDFQQYVYNHHMSWQALARGRGLSLRVEDIVLVSGWFKTAEWSLAAYNSQDSHDFSLSINANGFFSANSSLETEEQDHLGSQQRAGLSLSQSPDSTQAAPSALPPRPPGPEVSTTGTPGDQCLFLQYYKCKPEGCGLTIIRNPQNINAKDMKDAVSDECVCAPFTAFMQWLKRCFGGCSRCKDLNEEESERVSTLEVG